MGAAISCDTMLPETKVARIPALTGWSKIILQIKQNHSKFKSFKDYRKSVLAKLLTLFQGYKDIS